MTGSATGLPNTYAVEIVAPDLSAYAAATRGCRMYGHSTAGAADRMWL
jgi:hypothetical protein